MTDVQMQVSSRFERRPSYWKTPAGHLGGKHAPSSIGKKRHYDEITDSNNNTCTTPSPASKKRRLLTHSEISNIAKVGGFNPNNIVLAFQESDGFCWFKRQTASKQTQTTDTSNDASNAELNNDALEFSQLSDASVGGPVLRELSKDELKQKTAQALLDLAHKAMAAHPELNNEKPKPLSVVAVERGDLKMNPNERNRLMMEQAKKRRHTAPPHVLRSLADADDADQSKTSTSVAQKRSPQTKDEKTQTKKKVRRKVKKKKIKKVITYETQEHIVRKKVVRKKRILKKKRIHQQRVRIITQFDAIDVPDLPTPALTMSMRIASDVNTNVSVSEWPVTLQQATLARFLIALIESLAVPIQQTFSVHAQFEFISSALLRFLMECRKNLPKLQSTLPVEVVTVPSDRGGVFQENDGNIGDEMFVDDDECVFYVHQLAMVEAMCLGIDEEMQVVEGVYEEMCDEGALEVMFAEAMRVGGGDGDVEDGEREVSVGDLQSVVARVASELDCVVSEHAVEVHAIECGQRAFERELERRRRRVEMKMKEFDGGDEEKGKFANFVQSNKLVGGGVADVEYLRRMDGYEMADDDTLNLEDMDMDMDMPSQQYK